MLSIKGGHVEVAPKRRSSCGGASRASETADASKERAAKYADGGQQKVHEKLSAAGYLAPSKQAANNVRLLSMISLIVIATLARQCTARAFLGVDAGNSYQSQGASMESYNNAADKQEMSLASGAAFAPADVEYVIELGCRSLVG